MKIFPIVAAGIVAVTVGAGAFFGYEKLGGTTPAPDVAYTLLDGSKASTGQLRGQVILLNFWATDCLPCVREMPQLAAIHEKYKARGFATLAVAMRDDPPAYVIRFAQTRHLPFGVVIDNTGEIARRFGQVQLTPTNLLINKRGEIVKRYVGEPDFVAMQHLVEQLLAET